MPLVSFTSFSFSVEELLGMILSHAKSQAETFTEQPIKDAVITVPVFFNQVLNVSPHDLSLES